MCEDKEISRHEVGRAGEHPVALERGEEGPAVLREQVQDTGVGVRGVNVPRQAETVVITCIS